MNTPRRTDLVHDLFLPTLLFAALGGMTWAVRGCTGFGGTAGCLFAGVAWGTAWWFIAREPRLDQSRRYATGWIVLAVTIGVGIAGARGWMQWPSFFEGKLQTNYARGETVPISRVYGFVWLFIAGMPWAGLGACMLAWCGSLRTTRAWHWTLRIGCGIGSASLAYWLFKTYPQYFLPLYESLEDRYRDTTNNPNLRRLTNDCRSAIIHLGLYLGFFGYELGRRDWKNVLLIGTVGVLNGAGWALCQNWKWAPNLWPDTSPNWWRCWESSGGISIGIAFGVSYFLVNRRMSASEHSIVRARRSLAAPTLEGLSVYLGLTGILGLAALSDERRLREEVAKAAGMSEVIDLLAGSATFWTAVYVLAAMAIGVLYYFARRRTYASQSAPSTEAYGDPNLERLGLALGLFVGLGFSLRNAIKGWFNIYRGREEQYTVLLWQIFGLPLLLCLVAVAAWIVLRPLPRDYDGDRFPHAGAVMWLVLVALNVMAQIVTGPLTNWNEVTFSIYYLLLLAITAVIAIHYSMRIHGPSTQEHRSNATFT